MKKNLVCIGNGSVAKISVEILKNEKTYQNIKIIQIPNNFKDKKVFNNLVNKLRKNNETDFILGFANIKLLEKNWEVFQFFKKKGVKFINIVDPSAIVNKSVKLGKGIKIYPGVIINTGCIIKDNVLINTGSVIDHDCKISENSQIAPGCRLAGNVKIGRSTFIGIGSSIIQGVKIGKNCIVGAGSVVIKNIPNNSTYAGVPARKII
tara:strand:+ start:839 stop:1459 length:621 start_codon:yes stop_codon:yes gene_type:complete